MKSNIAMHIHIIKRYIIWKGKYRSHHHSDIRLQTVVKSAEKCVIFLTKTRLNNRGPSFRADRLMLTAREEEDATIFEKARLSFPLELPPTAGVTHC